LQGPPTEFGRDLAAASGRYGVSRRVRASCVAAT
jgi:hypothetical protein